MYIREAKLADAPGIARVHVDSWRSAYRGLMPQSLLDGLSADDRTARWARTIEGHAPGSRPLVAEKGGEILAWSSFGVARDEGAPASGELWAIYAHPEYWSTGIGHALLTATEDALRDGGHSGAYLWVLEGNDRAATFYERHGWSADGESKNDQLSTITLRELRYVKTFS